MADGDYERGRSHEIAAIAARLKRLASNRPTIHVLNGWAASPRAWDLCKFIHKQDCKIHSYTDQLNARVPLNRPTILVGWSMGGSMALKLASENPDKIAGLVLLAATPRMMQDEGWRGMSERRLDALRKGLEMTHGEGFFGVPEGKPNPYMTDSSENLERGLKYLLETDLRSDLIGTFKDYKRNFPVYIYQSERDGIVRSENAGFLKTIFPHAKLAMIPGSEHALPIQIPQEIDDAVDACIKIAAQG